MHEKQNQLTEGSGGKLIQTHFVFKNVEKLQ